MLGVAGLIITLHEKSMASVVPDHNPHADAEQLDREFQTLSLHSDSNGSNDNKNFAATFLSSATLTSDIARPCFYCVPHDCDLIGTIDKSNSPPSLGNHCRAKSNGQQRPSLANTARYASTQPADCHPAPKSNETKKHFAATDPPSQKSAIVTFPDVNLPDIPTEETRSKPIPIAVPRRKPKHTGLTPLSGRPPPTYASDGFLSSICARSRTPSPSSSFHTHYSTPISVLSLDRHPYKMSSRPSQSSPLSPTAPARPMAIPHYDKYQSNETQSKSQHKPRHRPAVQSLNLAGLPKYHPANFPTSGDNTPLSPRSIQALNASKCNPRPGSDAQHALHKYQREIVTRASGLPELAKPTSPRLIPEGSPAGSMTPLALEAQSDYLLSRSNMPANNADARKLVDQILQKENEERGHPEARKSGSVSPAITPPV